MNQIVISLTLVVALLHWLFFILESYLWQKPLGLRIFKMNKEKAAITAQLAVNQGFYNAFLSVGLLACVMLPEKFGPDVLVFFHLCVVVAAVVGALTVSRTILFVQGVPAALALLAIYFL